MKKVKKSYILLPLFLLLYPIFTLINFMFNDIEYLLVININFTLIDRIMIFTVCENIYDGIFYVVLGALKVVIFTVLLIIMLIKPKKGLYALEFIILFVDMLCLVGLSNNYIIVFINILFHILSLFLVGKAIKSFDEY